MRQILIRYRQINTSSNSYYEKTLSTGAVRCIDDEIPFDIPDSWAWCRLGEISTYAQPKRKINASKADSQSWGLDLEDIEKGGRLLNIRAVGERKAIGDKTIFNCGDILYSKLRPYLLKILVAPKDGICTPEIIPFSCYGNIRKEYIVNFLKAPYVDDHINSSTFGVKMPRVSTETMTSLLVPLPPLSEQIRIEKRIEELMPFIEKYGKAQDSLNTLNNGLSDSVRRSILQEAIQGRLVPQIESEGTAEELLEEIRTEKKRLVKEGKLKKSAIANESRIFRDDDNKYYEKNDDGVVCIENEIPFEIPDSWTWVRLDDICSYIQRGKSPKYSLVKQIPVVAQKCNQWSGFQIEKAQFIEPSTLSSYGKERMLQDGDLMWNSTGLGTLGRMAVYKESLNPYGIAVADSHVTVIRPCHQILSDYLFLYFTSYTVQSVIEEKSDGSTKQKELSTTTVKKYLVPLPPHKEQERIICRINEALASIMSR